MIRRHPLSGRSRKTAAGRLLPHGEGSPDDPEQSFKPVRTGRSRTRKNRPRVDPEGSVVQHLV